MSAMLQPYSHWHSAAAWHACNLIALDHALHSTVVYREIETAVPDERILVLFVPYILLTRSYNIKVNIFGLNEVKIEIESPGAALCTCLVPNLYSLRYPK